MRPDLRTHPPAGATVTSGPARRARWALVVNTPSGGTYGNLLGRLAIGLAETGRIDPTLVCYSEDEAPEWLPEDVRVVRLGTQRAAASLLPLVRYLRDEQPDVVLTHMVHQNLLGLGAAALARLSRRWTGKLVIGHDHPAHLSHQSSRWDNKWVAKYAYRFATGVVAASPPVRDDALGWCGLAPSKVGMVANPIDAFGGLSPEAPHRWLERGRSPVFVTAGRLVAYKRFDLLIEAFRDLVEDHDARLLIIGTGDASDGLGRQIDDLGLSDKVELVGWVEDPRQWSARATAFILPSNEEGWGQVLTEAMSAGCPVLTTDALGGGPALVTDNGRFGILVPREDREALRRGMERLLDPAVRAHYADLGKERVGAFSPMSCASALVDFVETLD